MTPQVKRRYDSTGRRAGSDSTQRRIVEAATELFLRDGYGRTSIDAIADFAHVSPATIYKLFGNKAAIAKRVGDVAVAGDHGEIPLDERDWVQTALDDPDPAHALRRVVEGGTAVLARITPIIEMADAAAHLEPALAGFVAEGDRGRWHGMSRFVGSLRDRGALRSGLSIDEATDIMWTIQSPATYGALVLAQGWTFDQYRAWVLDQLEHAILTGRAFQRWATPSDAQPQRPIAKPKPTSRKGGAPGST
jgi:AcrR family transcriptional regulator